MRPFIEFVNNSFGIDNNTSSTIIITLMVFAAGFIITGSAKLYSNSRSRKLYRAVFKNMIEEISKSSFLQSSAFLKFKEGLSIENSDLPPLDPENISLLQNFIKIPFETFYDAYFKGVRIRKRMLNIEDFNKIFSITETLTNSESNYRNDVNEFNTRFISSKSQWDLYFSRIGGFVANFNYYNKDNRQNASGDFYNKLYIMMSNWRKEENSPHYFVAYNKFLIPFNDFLNLPENQIHINEMFPIISDISRAKESYNNLKYVFSAYYSLFEHYERNYNDKGDQLKTLLNNL